MRIWFYGQSNVESVSTNIVVVTARRGVLSVCCMCYVMVESSLSWDVACTVRSCEIVRCMIRQFAVRTWIMELFWDGGALLDPTKLWDIISILQYSTIHDYVQRLDLDSPISSSHSAPCGSRRSFASPEARVGLWFVISENGVRRLLLLDQLILIPNRN